MQEAKHPTTTKLPSQSQSSSPSPSAPAANPLRYHHGYGTFPPPFQPTPPPPPVVGAACHDYHASPIGGCSPSRRHYPRFSPLLVLRYDSIDASVSSLALRVRRRPGLRRLPVRRPAAGLRGGRPRPRAAPTVLRRRRRLVSVLIGVLLGGNPLVCWRVPSILCCFGPQREAWIDCMHRCWHICTSSIHSERYEIASFLVINDCQSKST